MRILVSGLLAVCLVAYQCTGEDMTRVEIDWLTPFECPDTEPQHPDYLYDHCYLTENHTFSGDSSGFVSVCDIMQASLGDFTCYEDEACSDCDPLTEVCRFGLDSEKQYYFSCDSTPPPCDEELDIIFNIDRSGSISRAEMDDLKAGLLPIALTLMAQNPGIYIGISTFHTTGIMRQSLTNDAARIDNRISTLARGGFTCTPCGLEKAIEALDEGEDDFPDRVNVPNIFITFTDGNCNRQCEDLNAAAAAVQARGRSIAVGIGDGVDASTLNAIASSAGDVINVADFGPGLQAKLADIIASICA